MYTNEILKDAPKYIISRFESINKYAWNTIIPHKALNEWLYKWRKKDERNQEFKRIKEIISEAFLVLFIFLLNRFFQEGTRAAIDTVDTLKQIGVGSLQIGAKIFEERNENVMMGDQLSEKMMASIEDEKLIHLITHSKYASEIVMYYKKEIYG